MRIKIQQAVLLLAVISLFNLSCQKQTREPLAQKEQEEDALTASRRKNSQGHLKQTKTFSAGIRNEGSPVEDLVGGSEGLRRAGHNLSIEPGIVYKMKKTSIYAYVPIIVDRKISQNMPDKFKTKYLGTNFVSPGGSGNYQVFVGVLFKL